MSEIARLTINLSEAHKLPESSPLKALVDRVLNDNALKSKIGNECTVVYHGCGTCPDGQSAMVEYYCTAGGNEPDYIICEACD